MTRVFDNPETLSRTPWTVRRACTATWSAGSTAAWCAPDARRAAGWPSWWAAARGTTRRSPAWSVPGLADGRRLRQHVHLALGRPGLPGGQRGQRRRRRAVQLRQLRRRRAPLRRRRRSGCAPRASTPARCSSPTTSPAPRPTEIAKRRGIAGDFVVFKMAGAAAERGRRPRRRWSGSRSRPTTARGPWAWRSTAAPSRAPTTRCSPCPRADVAGPGHPRRARHRRAAAALAAETGRARWSPAARGRAARTPATASCRSSTAWARSSTTSCSCCTARSRSCSRDAGLTVVEPECGELVTSLDMAGFSLTLLWLDEELERALARSGRHPRLPQGQRGRAPARRQRRRRTRQRHRPATRRPRRPTTPRRPRPRRPTAVAVRALAASREAIARRASKRSSASSTRSPATATTASACAAGSMPRAAAATASRGSGVGSRVLRRRRGGLERTGRRDLGRAVGRGARRALGAARSTRDRRDGRARWRPPPAARGLVASRLGKAEPGDKTMVDALVPVRRHSWQSSTAGLRWPTPCGCRRGRRDRRRRGDRGTAAPLGRARPLAERSVGHPDPGATSLALVLTASSTDQHRPRTPKDERRMTRPDCASSSATMKPASNTRRRSRRPARPTRGSIGRSTSGVGARRAHRLPARRRRRRPPGRRRRGRPGAADLRHRARRGHRGQQGARHPRGHRARQLLRGTLRAEQQRPGAHAWASGSSAWNWPRGSSASGSATASTRPRPPPPRWTPSLVRARLHEGSLIMTS